jgi:hypothetical protein
LVFVGDDVLLQVSFDAACTRLIALIRAGALSTVSREAYTDSVTDPAGAGRLAPEAGHDRLAKVKLGDPVTNGDSLVVALRWEAAGSDGGLFPVLDADIKLTPAGEHHICLRLDGTLRPPPGALRADRAILRRIAAATARCFLDRVGAAIVESGVQAGRPT